MVAGVVKFGPVPIHKDRVIKLTLAAGAFMMGADMLAALGPASWIGDHLAHVLGASGATVSGFAAWIDASVRGVEEVIADHAAAIETAESL